MRTSIYSWMAILGADAIVTGCVTPKPVAIDIDGSIELDASSESNVAPDGATASTIDDEAPLKDAGLDASLADSHSDAGSDRIVFLTAAVSAAPGGRSPLKTFDAMCNLEAARSPNTKLANGNYKAFVGDSKTTASQRLQRHDGRFVKPDGTVIAASWEQFTGSASLSATIDQSAYVENKPSEQATRFWLGKGPVDAGTFSANSDSCDDWTTESNAATAIVGNTDTATPWSTPNPKADTPEKAWCGGFGGTMYPVVCVED